MAVGRDPTGLGFGHGAVWAGLDGGTVVRIDPVTSVATATIPLGVANAGPTWLAVDDGGVWAAVSGDQLVVLRIDPVTNGIVARLAVGPDPTRPAPLAVGENGVWATNFGESTVTRIDPQTNVVVAKIPTTPEPERADRGHPSGVAVTAGAVWVVNHREATVLRIDPVSNRVVATIPVDAGEFGPGRATAGAGAVWISNSSGWVQRIDPTTNTVGGRLACSNAGPGVAAAGFVWVTQFDRRAICRVDPQTGGTASYELRSPAGETFRNYQDPSPIAFGAGALWVGDRATDRVLRVTPPA